MAKLNIALFGPIVFTLDDQVLRDFRTDKTRALLIYLAVEQQAERREKLAGFFWPLKSENLARQNLSQALYILRLLLGDKQTPGNPGPVIRPGLSPFILAQPDSLQLNPNSDTWVDVLSFTNLVEESKHHNSKGICDCVQCLEKLENAVALYRGDFLSNFSLRGSQPFEEWATVECERHRRLALTALDHLISCRVKRGDLEVALSHAWRQVELDPLWEHAQRQLIDLLTRTGRHAAALAQYDACQQILLNELGLSPEKSTEALVERIRKRTSTAVPPSAHLHNLPAALTPFVGRKAELANLLACLDDPACRLLTLTGPGGSGKTRLALEAARAATQQFPDGVWLVLLAPQRSANAISGAIAEALGLPLQPKPSPTQQLKAYLQAKRLLLVLDSFEHLLAGARLPVEILQEAQGIKILVTSRQRLNVHGEQRFPLDGLKIPHAREKLDQAKRSEAVQLFLTAGQRVLPRFELSNRNLDSVIRICALVGGMPLGLLLAAAWLDALSTAEVATEIERGLDFLSVEWENLPDRQRSLRATFDYSWRYLAKDEQVVLGRLAVFRGGFTQPAAQEVAGASRPILRALVEKSMLGRSLTGRYEMHELLRQYAWEKQASEGKAGESVEGKHASYFLRKMAGWAHRLTGGGQPTALDEMDSETGNLATAWARAAENGRIDLLSQGLQGLMMYYDLQTRLEEGQAACLFALDRLSSHGSPTVQRFSINAGTWKAHFMLLRGQHDLATQQLNHLLAELKEFDINNPPALAALAFVQLELGYATLPNDRPAAKRSFEDCIRIYEDLGDKSQVARALAGLGMVAHHSDTFEEAVRIYQQCLTIYDDLGDQSATAKVLIELGHNSFRQGLFEDGESYIYRGCEIYEQIGDRASTANTLLQLSRLNFWRGDFSESLSNIDKAMPLFKELGWFENYAFTVSGKGIPLVLIGSYKEARLQGQAGLAVAWENNFQRNEAAAYWVLGMTEVAERAYQTARDYLDKSIVCYRAIQQNDELGWALAAQAYTDLAIGNRKAFRHHLCETLRLSLEIKGLFPILLALPAAALNLIEDSQTFTGDATNRAIADAVELFALARRYPTVGNAQWFEDVAGNKINAAAANLPLIEVEAAQARGQQRDLFETAGELLAAYSG